MSDRFKQFNIQSLRMVDFRKFKDYFIKFNLEPRNVFHGNERIPVGPLTVLVAKNGMGKTSALDAIRILFGRYTAPFKFASQVHLLKTDIRIASDNPQSNSEPAAKASVSGEVFLDGKLQFVDRELSSKKGMRTTTSGVACINDFALQAIQRRKSPSETEWPLLAFYGTGRLWSEHRNRFGKKNVNVLADYGYENCLGENHNFKAVDTWLFDALFEKFATRLENLQEPTATVLKLKAVESALQVVLGSEGYESGLLLNPKTKEVAVKKVDGGETIVLSVSQLSDGVRAVFGLVADIAFRCAVLNPQFGTDAPARTHGIVLVDEVDLHLHPSWQQKILNTLQLAFPKLQFIVTTHSPQVVSSVPMECVAIIDEDEAESESSSSQTQGVESQDILANVFGTNPAPEQDEWVVKLSEYATKVALGRAGEQDPLYQELVGHYGTDYQPLLRIELQRRFLNRKETPHA